MKMNYVNILLLFAIVLVLAPKAFPQLKLTISTDKQNYNYGDVIHIKCTVENISDTTVTDTSGCYKSMQAEFSLDDYFSYKWSSCLTILDFLVFPPHGKRTYSWTIDPQRFGLPDKDGRQLLVGYFLGGLTDTTYINAPLFKGGQLELAYLLSDSIEASNLKDSLNAVVLNSVLLQSLGERIETWQLEGKPLDSLYNLINGKSYIKFVEYNRRIDYDSITVTSIKENKIVPVEYFVSNAYPNPFNPVSFFYVSVKESQHIKIELYNTLGEKVSQIYNGYLSAGDRHKFEIEGNDLTSGIYFYKVTGKDFSSVKKVMLLK